MSGFYWASAAKPDSRFYMMAPTEFLLLLLPPCQENSICPGTVAWLPNAGI